MNPLKSSRLPVFAGIVAVIIILHVIVLSIVINSSSGGKLPEEQLETPAAVQKAPSREEKQNLPEQKKAEEKNPAEKERYRRKSGNPRFGRPLDYSGARRGAMPPQIIPGDSSTSGIIADMQTRKVLWEKNSRKAVPVASMSKMMTILLVMEHLEKSPALSLDTPVKISPAVLRLPSREGIVWLDPRETFPISDLIKCAAVKSANDAALQLALTVAGSEEKFVAMMNARARAAGMTGTRFINAHGLPDKKRNQSLSTVHDMVLLGECLLEYPVVMAYFKTPSAHIREGKKKTVIRNTNRLIYKNNADAEGMKTGYTRKAGFCLTFSAVRNGRRLMGCVTGFPTSRERDKYCKALLDWAFNGCPAKQISQPAPKKKAVRKSAVRKNRSASKRSR